MSKYSFDVRDCQNLLPPAIRKGMLHTLVTFILTPVVYIYRMFLNFQYGKTYRLEHNGQVYSLERIIREHCNDNDCHITDGEYVDETMVPYDGKESLANYQVQIPYDGDVNPQVNVMYAGFGQITQDDFIVHLPKDLYGNIDETGLRAKIDGYKLAGKTYAIKYDDVIIETYGFGWSEPFCVQEETVSDIHNFRWTDPVCVQVENLPLRFRWADPICAQKENFTTSKQ